MKRTKMITIILVVVLISLIAFVGIYVKKQNRMENIVKDYELGMNLKGARKIELEVKEEEITIIKDAEGNVIEEELTDEQITEKGYTKEVTKVNNQEKYTIDDYKKSKEIIEKRLNQFGVEEYLIRINESNGAIICEIPENDATDYIVSNIGQVSEFKIIDTQTKEVLMDNNDLKKVSVLYGRTSEETNDISVFLNFEFSQDGTNKLTDITNKYVKIEEETENVETEETTENAEEQAEETSTEKTITMMIDESEMITTSFEDPITNGVLQLTMGAATSNEKQLQENMKSATTVSTLLNSESLPVEYEIGENKYIISNVQDEFYIIISILAIITVVLILVLTIKYRVLGLLCGITSIGVLAIISLLIRYTNIQMNLETILGVVIIMVLNFILLIKLLEKVKFTQELKKGIKDTFIKFFVQIIPICLIVIVFAFTGWNPIYNLGLTMFWGIIVIAIYNLLITRTILLIKENK